MIETAADREKLVAAERNVALVRVLVVAFNAATVFLLDPAQVIWPLAGGLIAVSLPYGIYVAWRRPHDRYPIIASSLVTTLGDGALIVLWVAATGGLASPYFLLFYGSQLAIAFRYPPRATLTASGVYAVGYAGLVAAMGQWGQGSTEMIIRLGYIFLIGALGALISKEVSLQTQAKHRSRALMRQAKAAEARFRALWETAPDAILLLDATGKILLANEQVDTVFSVPHRELEGRHVSEILPTGFEPADLLGYISTGGIQRLGLAGDLEAHHPDGTRAPVEVSLSPLTIPDQTLLVCIVRDISDRVRADRELGERADALARSNAELEQFAYIASHDLQEPLRMVSSYVQLLARRYQGQLDPDADEFIGYAVEGAERMSALIRDLLTLSRVGSRAAPFLPVDLRAVLDQTMVDLGPAIQEAGATIEVGRLPTVLGDRIQIGQLFQNLLGNAIKFRHPGRAPIVRISATETGEMCEITVEDNGIGIPDHHRDRVFVVFQRLHDRDLYPGTGIGLAICKKVVERHGGRIWVEPADGGQDGEASGTRFRFTLPLTSKGVPPRPPMEDPDGEVRTPEPRPSLRSGSHPTSG